MDTVSDEPLLQSVFGKWFDDHYAAAVKAMEEQAADLAGLTLEFAKPEDAPKWVRLEGESDR